MNEKNVGGVLKTLAVIFAALGVIGSLGGGIYTMAADDDLVLLGLVILFAGLLFTCLFAYLVYGFGELIEQVTRIRICCENAKPDVQEPEKVQKMAQSSGAPVAAPTAGRAAAAPTKGWTCSCGRVNPPYQTSCVCGGTKMSAQQKQQ